MQQLSYHTRLRLMLLPFALGIILLVIIPAGLSFSLAWLWILNPLFGPLNLFLRAIGLDAPNWLADPQWARPGLIVICLYLIARQWNIGTSEDTFVI